MHHVSVLYQDWFWGQLEHCKGTMYSYMSTYVIVHITTIVYDKFIKNYRSLQTTIYNADVYAYLHQYVVVYTIHFTLYFTCTVCSTVHVNVHVHNGIVTSIWINTYRYVNF